MKIWQLIVLFILGIGIAGCGGAGSKGVFTYGGKYLGTVTDGVSYPDIYLLLDSEGNIVPAESYVGQISRCTIGGSVRKSGSKLIISVEMTMPIDNACSTNVLTATGQMSYDSGTKWWTGTGTGHFSDDPGTNVVINFSLYRDNG